MGLNIVREDDIWASPMGAFYWRRSGRSFIIVGFDQVVVSGLFELFDHCASRDAICTVAKLDHWDLSRLDPAVYRFGAHFCPASQLLNGEEFGIEKCFLIDSSSGRRESSRSRKLKRKTDL